MFTLQHIKNYLDQLTSEQLQQSPMVHMHNPNADAIQVLDFIVAIGTVKEFFNDDTKTRSPEDNQHHSENVIFLADSNLFDE